MLEVAELIRELSESDSPLKFIDRAQDDPAQRQRDITLARNAIGWRFRVVRVPKRTRCGLAAWNRPIETGLVFGIASNHHLAPVAGSAR